MTADYRPVRAGCVPQIAVLAALVALVPASVFYGAWWLTQRLPWLPWWARVATAPPVAVLLAILALRVLIGPAMVRGSDGDT